MGTVNTTVSVSAEAKGFAQAQAAATKFTDALNNGMTKMPIREFKKNMKELEGQLTDIAKKQLKLNDAMGAFKDMTKVPKAMSDEMRNLEREAGRVEQKIQLVNRVFKENAKQMRDHAAAQGSFTQGFLNAAVPGAGLIQRGPGAWGQAAGGYVGGTLRGMAGGLASTPYSGFGGVAQSLGHVPVIGAALSAGMGAAAGYAHQALGFLGSKQEAMPYLGGTGGMSSSEIEQRAAGAGLREMNRNKTVGGRLAFTIGDGVSGGSWKGGRDESPGERAARAQAAADGERSRLQGASNRARNPVDLGQGVNFGMDMEKTQSFAMQMAMSGGTGGKNVNGMLGAALGANRMFGVDAGTSGAFLGGGVHGAVSGGKMSASASGDMMAKTIGDAVAMGLEGSQINEYLSTMAGAMKQWEATGMPVNPTAMGGVAGAFNQAGLGGIRGANAARGFESGVNRLAGGGPESAVDMLAMRKLVGYDFSGGAEGLQNAKLDLENKNFKKGGMEDFMKSLFVDLTPNAATNDIAAQKNLGKFGVQLSATEAKRMGDVMRAKASGKAISKKDQEFINEKTSSVPDSGAGLEAGGAGMVNGLLKDRAATDNKQITTGLKLITTMNNFDRSMTDIASTVTTITQPALNALSSSIRKATGWIDKFSTAVSTGGN